jgi:hypothetical protein
MATTGVDGILQDGIVPGEGDGHGVGVIFPEAGTAFNIRKKECDGSGGRRVHDAD